MEHLVLKAVNPRQKLRNINFTMLQFFLFMSRTIIMAVLMPFLMFED